jgi:uncharacterized Fe-S radical SAM superfamily protein PflX
MEQYRPMYKAHDHPEINRGLTMREFADAYDYARRRGLRLAE